MALELKLSWKPVNYASHSNEKEASALREKQSRLNEKMGKI